MKSWTVQKNQSGIRLSDFLREVVPETLSAKAIKRHIENTHCQVNEVVERFASRKLFFGDKVEFDITGLGESLEKKRFEAHQVLFEDDHLMIYNKPAGVTCTSEGIIKLLEPHGKYILVHRLDKETTGILLLAKNAKMESFLVDEFRQRKISKTYLALVDGCPKDVEGTIRNRLGKISQYDGQTVYGAKKGEETLEAITHWKLLKAAKLMGLIECNPETGRTHQIRAHMAGLGHPILGDYQYGKKFRHKARPLRVLLHASSIAFYHPILEKTMHFIAPLPQDFKELMKVVW